MSSLSARDISRSPRFPSQSLEESLRHAEAIYDSVHRSSVDSSTIYRLMGFSGKSGTSAKALGALRQYGLIEGIGEKTRISDLALAILEPETPSEKSHAIQLASKSPDVFGEILGRFDGRVPQADEAIRAFLIRELGFQKNSADECIKSLRQSLAFADNFRAPEIAIDAESIETIAASEAAKPVGQVQTAPSSAQAAGGEIMVLPLTKDCRAELRIFGELNSRAIHNLIRHINLFAEVWAEDESG